jgi:hypothetical protein
MKTNPFLADLEAIAHRAAVLDEHTYRVLGQQFSIPYQQAYTRWHQPFHHFGQNTGDENHLRSSLQQQLAQTLYSTFYCAGTAELTAATALHPTMPDPAEHARTIQLLSEANTTPNGFDPFWKVYAIDNQGNAFVSKNSFQRQLMPNQWVFDNPAETRLQVGTLVKLLLPKEDTTVQPVFYHVRGTELVPQQVELVRVYFHTTFEGSLALVRDLTTTFNEYRLPFLFKCLNHPDLYTRADSAVLYVSKFDFRLAYSLLRPIVARLAPHLQTTVPLFTRALWPGVSFAEDPAHGLSFGIHRCGLVAEGLLEAHRKKATTGAKQFAEVQRTFAKNGIDIARIYLNPNSHFSYNLAAPARESQPASN